MDPNNSVIKRLWCISHLGIKPTRPNADLTLYLCGVPACGCLQWCQNNLPGGSSITLINLSLKTPCFSIIYGENRMCAGVYITFKIFRIFVFLNLITLLLLYFNQVLRGNKYVLMYSVTQFSSCSPHLIMEMLLTCIYLIIEDVHVNIYISSSSS